MPIDCQSERGSRVVSEKANLARFIYQSLTKEGEKLNQYLAQVKANIDPKVVTSVVVGSAIFGAIIYAAIRTGIAPLKTVANVASGK